MESDVLNQQTETRLSVCLFSVSPFCLHLVLLLTRVYALTHTHTYSHSDVLSRKHHVTLWRSLCVAVMAVQSAFNNTETDSKESPDSERGAVVAPNCCCKFPPKYSMKHDRAVLLRLRTSQAGVVTERPPRAEVHSAMNIAGALLIQ